MDLMEQFLLMGKLELEKLLLWKVKQLLYYIHVSINHAKSIYAVNVFAVYALEN